MKNIPLQIVRKDTKTYEFRLSQNGVAIDISGWTVYFTAKIDFNDADSSAVIIKNYTFPNNTDSQNGIGRLDLTTTDTNVPCREYYYDFKFIGTDLRETFLRGILIVIPSIRTN